MQTHNDLGFASPVAILESKPNLRANDLDDMAIEDLCIYIWVFGHRSISFESTMTSIVFV
jgi:hypothetical protein